jgi:predicted dehydrogenase
MKIAVVGAGLIGRKHIELVANDGCLSAIVDPAPASQALAQEHGVAWYPTIQACFEKDLPDGAIVATPNQMHVEHGLACIDAGVAMLMEKPIADSSVEAEALVSAAEQKDVPILVGHHRRHNPLIKAAKGEIEAQRLGKIVAVNAQFWLYKPDDYFSVQWRSQKGAGPVFINLIHDIDLLRHLCGEVVSVQAIESNKHRNFEVEDTSAILVRFENGALGTVNVSDTVVAPWSWELTSGENPAYPKTPMSCYKIGGTEASMSIPDMTVWSHEGEKSWWSPIQHETVSCAQTDPLRAQLLHFQQVIKGNEKPLVSGREGLQTLRVIEAIKQAAVSGQMQHL